MDANSFWSASAKLRHIHTFARARMCSPWAVLGVCLARVVAATPATLTLPATVGGKGCLNLFIGLVGPSGAGKGAAAAAAADALDVGYVKTVNVGSAEGLAHAYATRDKKTGEQIPLCSQVLVSIPEIDTLTHLAGRNGNSVLAELRKAWSGEPLGFQYADPTKRLTIDAHTYRLALVCGIQPLRAEGLLDDADGGTPQRYLWLPATDPEIPDSEPVEPAPLQWYWREETFRKAHLAGVEMKVPFDITEQIRNARRATMKGTGDPLDGHRLYATLKTAAALALLDGRAGVDDEDWQLALVVMDVSTRTRNQVQSQLAAEKRETLQKRAVAEAVSRDHAETFVEERAVLRISDWIGQWLKQKQRMPTSHIKRNLNSRDRQYVDQALDRLLAEKCIKATRINGTLDGFEWTGQV